MILDSSVIVAIILGESDRTRYLSIIHRSQAAKISTATVLECYVVIYGKVLKGECQSSVIQDLDAFLSDPKIDRVDVTSEQIEIAKSAYWTYGRLSRHLAKLNYGDCFSYALAKQLGEPLLFKGNDFVHSDVSIVSNGP